jgi:hypothetical protein
MGTGCISPGGQLPATFFAALEAGSGPSRRPHNLTQVRCWSNRTWPSFGFCYWIWTQNGKVVSTSASYMFTMPSANTTLMAHFK